MTNRCSVIDCKARQLIEDCEYRERSIKNPTEEEAKRIIELRAVALDTLSKCMTHHRRDEEQRDDKRALEIFIWNRLASTGEVDHGAGVENCDRIFQSNGDIVVVFDNGGKSYKISVTEVE